MSLENEFELDDRLREELDNPRFEQKGRVHDWRNYISDVLVKHWGSLSLESRLIAHAMAERQADAEEWD